MTLPGFFEGTGMPDAGWWEALWAKPAKVLTDVGIKPGMSAVDLCCGDGWFTLQMARLARHVIAIDIDSALLDAARMRLAESGFENRTFVEADAFRYRRCCTGTCRLRFSRQCVSWGSR
ncbi:MAG TPA: methyltransferase domain-containing protein [Beijerinckiaceae bacterium]|nr:methyltransferase domain-containing protein [Beijerinckiaceae bacterium]